MALLLEKGYAAGDQSGGREDLSNLIANVDSRSTPFTSMAKKGKKPGNALMSWQMDAFEDPKITGFVDGTDVDMTQASTTETSANPVFVNPAGNRVLASNYVQMFRRTFRISSLANEIQVVAGVKSELANGIAKSLVELKRDMELTFLNDGDAQVDAGGTTPYLTKALGSFLDADGQTGSSCAAPVNANFYCNAREATKTTSNITETEVQNVLKTLFENSGTIRDYDLLLGTALKRAFTGFTQSVTAGSAGDTASPIKTFAQDASSKSFINAIDLFEGDFGRLRLHPSTFIARAGSVTQAVGYVIPFEQAEIRYGKLPQIKELTDNGGGPARLVEAVAALVVHNPKAFGIFDLAS
jgi:hypothetical protein|tara:strand:+ start:75 stop:1139 length:1065 start_codon:yes stop_codon:yes gene_type:complete